MEFVITVLILAALGAVLCKHIRDSKVADDDYDFDGELPRDDDGQGRAQP